MNRIGLLKIRRNKLTEGTWEANFPETPFNLYLQTVSSSKELKNGEEFQKTFGYRLILDLEITRLPDNYYITNHSGMNIFDEAIQLFEMFNEIIKVNQPNREFKVYPDHSNSDFYLMGILNMDSLSFAYSDIVNNIGQTMSLSFCTKGYCDGKNYSPEDGVTFYLPDYLSVKEEE